MKPRELEKLLGGWAAGTLTAEERKELLRASLDDQRLFDALADEEGLRDLLADPAARNEMLDRLTAPGPVAQPAGRDWFKPALAMAATVFVAFVGIGVWRLKQPAHEVTHDVAAVEAPKAVAPPVSEPQAEADAKREEQPAQLVARREESRQLVAPQAGTTATARSEALPPPPDIGESRAAAGPPPSPIEAEFAAPRPPPAAPQAATMQQKAAMADSADVQYAPAAEGRARRSLTSVSWTVQRKEGEAFADVPQGTALRVGDEVRLRLRTKQRGSVTIGYKEQQSSVLVSPDQPSDFRIPWAVTSEPGVLRLQIAFIPQAQPQVYAPLRSTAAKTDIENTVITLRVE